MDDFHILQLLGKRFLDICQVCNYICHFPLYDEIPDIRYVCLLASTDIIISVMIPIIRFIKCMDR